jgi:hypothetical protein
VGDGHRAHEAKLDSLWGGRRVQEARDDLLWGEGRRVQEAREDLIFEFDSGPVNFCFLF